MKKIIMASLLTIPLGAMAYGETGRWSSGWGQGVSEYTAVVSEGNALYIACGEGAPVRMTLTVGGVRYGSDERQGFNLVIGGKEIQNPYETGSRVGANNFIFAWEELRKGKPVQAVTADGKRLSLPSKGVAITLPPPLKKGFPCEVE